MTSIYINFQTIRSVGQTFAERIGQPDECTSALGHVAVGFSWLEQSLVRQIAALAKISEQAAPAITAELSFKTKVSILSSLVLTQLGTHSFNVGVEDPKEVWKDILKMLSTCEELRNQLMHSEWRPLLSGEKMRRTKTTAKAAHGVRVTTEDLTADYLLDVYDYILNVDFILDEFFL